MNLHLLLILARLAVFEASFTETNQDAAAIVQVLRARNLLSEQGAHRYSPHFRRARYRPWIHHLSFSGAKPKGWPESRDWGKYRDAWFGTIASTADGLSGYKPCPVGTKHWGAPGFRASYWQSLGWTVQRCQGTRNWFWMKTGKAKKPQAVPEAEFATPYGYWVWMTTQSRGIEYHLETLP